MPYKDPEKRKEYREKNKDKLKEYQKEYRQKNKKTNRIGKWIRRGVIHQNFDELYEKYINIKNCELCNCELTEDKIRTSTTRCLDHDHSTGQFRNVVCHSCNAKRR